MFIKLILLALITAASVMCKIGEQRAQPRKYRSLKTQELPPDEPHLEMYPAGEAEIRFEKTVDAANAYATTVVENGENEDNQHGQRNKRSDGRKEREKNKRRRFNSRSLGAIGDGDELLGGGTCDWTVETGTKAITIYSDPIIDWEFQFNAKDQFVTTGGGGCVILSCALYEWNGSSWDSSSLKEVTSVPLYYGYQNSECGSTGGFSNFCIKMGPSPDYPVYFQITQTWSGDLKYQIKCMIIEQLFQPAVQQDSDWTFTAVSNTAGSDSSSAGSDSSSDGSDSSSDGSDSSSDGSDSSSAGSDSISDGSDSSSDGSDSSSDGSDSSSAGSDSSSAGSESDECNWYYKSGEKIVNVDSNSSDGFETIFDGIDQITSQISTCTILSCELLRYDITDQSFKSDGREETTNGIFGYRNSECGVDQNSNNVCITMGGSPDYQVKFMNTQSLTNELKYLIRCTTSDSLTKESEWTFLPTPQIQLVKECGTSLDDMNTQVIDNIIAVMTIYGYKSGNGETLTSQETTANNEFQIFYNWYNQGQPETQLVSDVQSTIFYQTNVATSIKPDCQSDVSKYQYVSSGNYVPQGTQSAFTTSPTSGSDAWVKRFAARNEIWEKQSDVTVTDGCDLISCVLLRYETNSNSWSDCNIEQVPGTGIVGYTDNACSGKMCVTMDQSIGYNYQVNYLNSQNWISPLWYKVKCFIGAYSATQALEQPWMFCETGKCQPCFTRNQENDIIMTRVTFYSTESDITRQKIGDFTNFFDQNTDTYNYPYCADSYGDRQKYQVSKCELRSQGCLVSYGSGHVTMDTSTPWTIYMSVVETAGYDEQFCIYCFNDQGFAQFQELQVTQKKQVTCSDTITRNSAVPVSTDLINKAYSQQDIIGSDVAYQATEGNSVQFLSVISSEEQCKLTPSVDLFKSDCSTPYDAWATGGILTQIFINENKRCRGEYTSNNSDYSNDETKCKQLCIDTSDCLYVAFKYGVNCYTQTAAQLNPSDCSTFSISTGIDYYKKSSYTFTQIDFQNALLQGQSAKTMTNNFYVASTLNSATNLQTISIRQNINIAAGYFESFCMGFNFRDTTKDYCARSIPQIEDIAHDKSHCTDQDTYQTNISNLLNANEDEQTQRDDCEFQCFLINGKSFRFGQSSPTTSFECFCYSQRYAQGSLCQNDLFNVWDVKCFNAGQQIKTSAITISQTAEFPCAISSVSAFDTSMEIVAYSNIGSTDGNFNYLLSRKDDILYDGEVYSSAGNNVNLYSSSDPINCPIGSYELKTINGISAYNDNLKMYLLSGDSFDDQRLQIFSDPGGWTESLLLRGLITDGTKHQDITLTVTVCGAERLSTIDSKTIIIVNELTSSTGTNEVNENTLKGYFSVIQEQNTRCGVSIFNIYNVQGVEQLAENQLPQIKTNGANNDQYYLETESDYTGIFKGYLLAQTGGQKSAQKLLCIQNCDKTSISKYLNADDEFTEEYDQNSGMKDN